MCNWNKPWVVITCWRVFILILLILVVLLITSSSKKYSLLISEPSEIKINELNVRDTLQNINEKWKRRFDKEIVKCLDNLSSRLRDNPKRCENHSRIKLFFVGDSRIRQEFYSFLRLIPEHDRIWNGQPNETIISHYDMTVQHNLLDLEVKFFWRHIITDKLVAEIKSLTKKIKSADCPTGLRLVIIGINAHHLFPENGADYRTYSAMVEKLKNPLKELANLSTVMWMVNQKIMDFVFPSYLPNYVNEAKVHGLNNYALMAFNNSQIKFFSPSSSKADDYTRSCLIRRRTDYYQYFNCLHWVHLGYSVIYYNSLEWLSDLCNIPFLSYLS